MLASRTAISGEPLAAVCCTNVLPALRVVSVSARTSVSRVGIAAPPTYGLTNSGVVGMTDLAVCFA